MEIRDEPVGENGVATGRLRQLVRLSGELRLQQDLSDALGCSRMRVNRWARGVSILSEEELGKLADWYARVLFSGVPCTFGGPRVSGDSGSISGDSGVPNDSGAPGDQGVTGARVVAWLRGSPDQELTETVRGALKALPPMGRLRVAAGLTQGDVADLLAVSRVTYLGWENATQHPAYKDRIAKLRAAVGRFIPEERDPLAESRDGREE